MAVSLRLHAQLGDPRAATVVWAANMASCQSLEQVNLTHGFVSKQLSALSPLKRLPVLETSGQGVTSVPTMLRLVVAGSPLYAGSSAELAQIDSWTSAALNDFLAIADSWTAPIFGYAEDQPEVISYAQKQCMEYIGVLNAHLQKKNYICGEGVTIADIAWAGALTNLFRLVIAPKIASKFTEVTRWFTDISTNPHFVSAFGKVHMCRQNANIPKGIKIPKKFDPQTFEDPNKSQIYKIMEPRQSILLTAKQQLLWKKKAEADEVRRTKQFLKYQQEHTRARLHEQQMNDVKRLQDLEANYLNRLDELNTNMDTIEKNKEARRKAFLTKLESNHRGRILKKQSDIEELRSTQNVDIYEALDGVQEQAKELEETSRNSSDNSGLLSDSSTDNLTMITQSQDKHNKHLPPPTMLVPGRNGEVVSVHLVGSPMPVHDPIVARRARAKSDMGEYKNNSRPRSRSTGKIPSSRRISVCNKPASQARYDRKIKYRAASETMDKEALTSSNDKAKRLTAPGQKRRPVANSPKPPRHLGHSKKANQAPSALASLSSIDNTPSVVHRSYESQPFDKRQMKPEYHQFRDIRSSSYAKSPEFEGRSEKMKKMLNYYENRVQKDFAPKANQSLRDDLD